MSADPAGAIVFTDIVGFTQLTDVYGDDSAIELLALQDDLVNRALPPTGRLVKELGDGLLLWFDNGRDALATMLVLRDCFEEQTTNGRPLWVRMGLHWGRPKRRGDDIIGHDVNLAARIMDRAGPGELLCSEALVHEVKGEDHDITWIDFEPLGPVFVRGVKEPVALFRVTRPAPDDSPG